MILRISDIRSHDERWEADSLSEFSLGLYEALQRYNAWFAARGQQPPRPHLHVWTSLMGGRWIDAGYGRGTHIVVFTDMMANTAYLVDLWARCQDASANAEKFSSGLTTLLDRTMEDLRGDHDPS